MHLQNVHHLALYLIANVVVAEVDVLPPLVVDIVDASGRACEDEGALRVDLDDSKVASEVPPVRIGPMRHNQ